MELKLRVTSEHTQQQYLNFRCTELNFGLDIHRVEYLFNTCSNHELQLASRDVTRLITTVEVRNWEKRCSRLKLLCSAAERRSVQDTTRVVKKSPVSPGENSVTSNVMVLFNTGMLSVNCCNVATDLCSSLLLPSSWRKMAYAWVSMMACEISAWCS
eukprot:TRINITY_DN9989_c0_g1_i1.p2 TRINITY_DN9989_c0_g1~~TRINITY_DN9989_c0_g1_i1.p2  ORF type:complete len:157 (+),score=7.98 TRINITY_DN9989_c0_g1_i1:488-958(+)